MVKPRIHVVHVSTTFNHRAGGMQRLYKRLIAMRSDGYLVSLIVGRDCSVDPEWDMDGIQIYRVPKLVKYVDLLRDLTALWLLIRLLRQIRPDAVHTHLAKAGILGRWAAYVTGAPLILHTVHGPTFAPTLPLFRRLLYLIMEKVTGRITHDFVFVGEELRRAYIDAGICRPANAHVVRVGRSEKEIRSVLSLAPSDLWALRKSLLQHDHAFVMASVGRVVPSKQQAHAIHALQALRSRGVDAGLLIVGEGLIREEKGYAERLRALAVSLEVEDHVHFTGHREDVLSVIAASDVVLHTSKYEGLPNIPVEAALAAKPIVCYEVSGAREIIRDGETGFVVEQGDFRAIVERLFMLAGNASLSGSMGNRARQIISDEYSERRMIENTLNLYRRVVKNAGPETRVRRFQA